MYIFVVSFQKKAKAATSSVLTKFSQSQIQEMKEVRDFPWLPLLSVLTHGHAQWTRICVSIFLIIDFFSMNAQRDSTLRRHLLTVGLISLIPHFLHFHCMSLMCHMYKSRNVWKYILWLLRTAKTYTRAFAACINPCPAEPGYTLPLQIVYIQIRSQLIWICTVCHKVCEFIATIRIK